MRGYTVAAAAVTLRVSPKWLDNVLSHHSVAGVRKGRQGIKRLIAPNALLDLELALILTRSFFIPIGAALALAREIRESGGQAVREHSPFPTISLNLAVVRSHLDRRVGDAIEAAPDRPRGRPPRSKKNGAPDKAPHHTTGKDAGWSAS